MKCSALHCTALHFTARLYFSGKGQSSLLPSTVPVVAALWDDRDKVLVLEVRIMYLDILYRCVLCCIALLCTYSYETMDILSKTASILRELPRVYIPSEA